MKAITAMLLTSALLVATPVSAAILVNGLPTGPIFQDGYTNLSTNQNFLVRFTLTSASDVTGFEILERSRFVALGDLLRVKIRNDVGGSPALTNAFSFLDQTDAVSTYQGNVVKVTTNFTPITLEAGSYWFGVSGEDNAELWATYNNGGPQAPSYQRQLLGDAVGQSPPIYDLAFTVLGTNAGAVPELGTWAMLLLGFGTVGASLRHRRRPSKINCT